VTWPIRLRRGDVEFVFDDEVELVAWVRLLWIERELALPAGTLTDEEPRG
jgi:hypothetical protein